jgi:hypothetical protein
MFCFWGVCLFESMSSSARTVILGSWARTWKRMRVGYVGTPETSFLDSILLVTVSWQSDRVRHAAHAKFSQEYVTHFLSSSSFVSFFFFCQKSILVNNARVRRLLLDIEAGGLNVRKWFGEWCRVSATGSLRITERIIRVHQAFQVRNSGFFDCTHFLCNWMPSRTKNNMSGLNGTWVGGGG